ncbi:MAG: hypothetical protein IT384_20000 [Deltaproteobacteria bacterium]|nr:hypothetical protein [Deltaproteobacteria bacterium]
MWVPIAALSLVVLSSAPADGGAKLVFAARTRVADEWSPRRLFNAALRKEESDNLTQACQLLMAARLAPRLSFADELYARGAALRMVRLLAGRDDDAAAAVALLIGEGVESGELAPLVRTLVRRLSEPGLDHFGGLIVAVRLERASRRVVIDLDVDGGERRTLEADGPIGPFSAGQRVELIARRLPGRPQIGWRLIAMSAEGADGWQILRVQRIEGEPTDPEGTLLGSRRQDNEPGISSLRRP